MQFRCHRAKKSQPRTVQSITCSLTFCICCCLFSVIVFIVCLCFCVDCLMFELWARAALFYYLLSKFVVVRKRCYFWFFICTLYVCPLAAIVAEKYKASPALFLSLSVARSSSALLRVRVCVYVWLFAEQWMLLSTSTLPSSPLARVCVLRSTLHITRHHRCRDP